MRGRMRVLAVALLAAVALGGCLFFTPFSQGVRQVGVQVQSIEQRVTQLESAVGVGSSAVTTISTMEGGTAFGAPLGVPSFLSAGESMVSAETVPATGGVRWPLWPGRGAWSKLVRGLTNIITGWVEVPRRVHETTERSGPGTGFTWGVLRGIGYGFVRTVSGIYETVTFPVPAPSGYRPVMRPPYVFQCDEDADADVAP